MRRLSRDLWQATRVFFTAFYLFVGWLLFTWSLDLLSVLFGAFWSVFLAPLTYTLLFDEQEAERRSVMPRFYLLAVYGVILLYKMYVASFQVLWKVLRGDINPRVVHFRTRLQSDIGRIFLSNSITLTPGTITLDLSEDHLVVHWLDARTRHSRYAGELIKGGFERFLRRIFI